MSLQNAVNEANRKIVEDNSLKLAHEPQVQFPENKDEVEKAMDAKADLAFTVALEVLPSFELADLSDVSVKKPVAEVTDAEVNESLERMAKQNRSFATEGRRGGATATASRSTSSAASTARSSRAARARTSRSSSAPTPSSRASRSSSSALKAGDEQAREGRLPRQLPGRSISPARPPSSMSPSRTSRRRAS